MALVKYFTRWLRRIFKKNRCNLVIFGTDYPSYQLQQTASQCSAISVCYFIDDEPWTNRTYINNVQLRYPSELAKLAERESIVAALFTTEDAKTHFIEQFGSQIAHLPFKLWVVDANVTAGELTERVTRSG